MNRGQRCPACGSERIDVNDSSGVAACTNCGVVLEENLIVSSVEFSDSANGGSSIIGQFVSATCTKPFTSGPGHGYARESREVTISNGRRLISQVAGSLKLGQHYIDSAHRLFLLAVQRNFVQGRKTIHVVAACLYIVCRREKSPHLLIDFSDVLQTNVYVLGACFLKFIRLLNMKLPIIDPSLFIHRFAAKMEFEQKTHQVSMTALRLVARMKRDWIQTGRRPSGVCGAALIMSARMHGFKRTQKEVVKVLRICDASLRSRLLEFVSTASGDLTMEEFLQIDLPAERDPPSFLRNRKLEEAEKKRLQDEEEKQRQSLADGTSTTATTASALTTASEITVAATPIDAASNQNLPPPKISKKKLEKKRRHEEMYDNLESELEASLESFNHLDQTSLDAATAGDAAPRAATASISSSPIPSASSTVSSAASTTNALSLPIGASVAPPIGSSVAPPIGSSVAPPIGSSSSATTGTSAAALPARRVVRGPRARKPRPEIKKNTIATSDTFLNHVYNVQEEELSDMDEDDVDYALLDSTEVVKKTAIWEEMHKDYLIAKQKKDAADALSGKPKPKKRRKKGRLDDVNMASSAAEATCKMLESAKRVSKKINYAALKELFDTNDVNAPTAGGESV